MSTEEKIKYAETRIKELEMLINHWRVKSNQESQIHFKVFEGKSIKHRDTIAA